jgi:hypothetical protein
MTICVHDPSILRTNFQQGPVGYLKIDEPAVGSGAEASLQMVSRRAPIQANCKRIHNHQKVAQNNKRVKLKDDASCNSWLNTCAFLSSAGDDGQLDELR